MTVGTTPQGNVQALLAALACAPEGEWLKQGRALALHGDLAGAIAVFESATFHFPKSADAHLGWAGMLWQAGQPERAEQVLRDRLQKHPSDAAASFLLASLLRQQGRLKAVGDTLLSLFEHKGANNADTVIRAVEMLDDYGRTAEAATICENAIEAGIDDPRLHAYAGMLGIQLGRFERTRAHYNRALSLAPEAVDWNIPLGLSSLQRYESSDHVDFAFFHEMLQRPWLGEQTRRGVLFALGKAHDDLREFAAAATYLRQANAIAHAGSQWSRKAWKRSVEARLAAPANAITLPATDWTPVFIVGVPRSGTTLLADRLARHPDVRNRGELGWLGFWEQRLSARSPSRRQLEEAASQYAQQLRQDDGDARWYIDKQPLNLLRVDLAMALWPNARIIHCQRHPRDTALSLWQQSFHDPAHDYAYDFGDIATVIRDSRRLAAHWRKRYPASFLDVSYEAFVSAPDETLASIAQWLGLPATGDNGAQTSSSIATASTWQARQAIYTRSAGRWQHYATHVPELLGLPER